MTSITRFAKVFLLVAAAALATFLSSGCTASGAVYFTSDHFVVYEDRVVAIDGVWANDKRVVIAFRGEMGETPVDRDRNEDGEREVVASTWWLEAPLKASKMDGQPLPADSPGAILWSRGVESCLDRESLREGLPPPEALEGMRRLPFIDVAKRSKEKSVEQARDSVSWGAARHGVVAYAPIFWGRASRLDEKTEFTFGVARFDLAKREAELDGFALQRRVEQPYKYVALLMPVAMAVDLVLLPVTLPAFAIGAIVVSAFDEPESWRKRSRAERERQRRAEHRASNGNRSTARPFPDNPKEKENATVPEASE